MDGHVAGLRYQPDFLSAVEERRLLAFIETLEFEPVVLRGREAKRTVAQFGYEYDYSDWGIKPTRPLAPELEWLRDRVGELADVEAGRFEETLIIRYPPGAGMGWHRDAVAFGPVVVGVSLASAARMRFQRTVQGVRQVAELALAPRSAYVLSGAARSSWQHSIPAGKELRYSITFRTVRGSARSPQSPLAGAEL